MDFPIELLQSYGPLAGAVIWFCWRDWQREDRLSKRIDELETEQRHVVLPLVKECSAVIAKNTSVMERLETWLHAK